VINYGISHYGESIQIGFPVTSCDSCLLIFRTVHIVGIVVVIYLQDRRNI